MIMNRTGNGGRTGYPLTQTTTMHSEHGDFTTTTEVVELSKAELDASLFDVPAGYTEAVGGCYGKPSYNNAVSEAAPTKTNPGGSCTSYDPTNPFACGRWKNENGQYMGVGTGGGSSTKSVSPVTQPTHS